ncbi:hypothetical protein [Sinorhizobium fredii]|uniref:hypothetical protein n=1 Tax=Rhizobium fredii TaxID=380 RepID=UPI0005B3F3EC|nr:hypothetical protein [Sinorhizobium fredii]
MSSTFPQRRETRAQDHVVHAHVDPAADQRDPGRRRGLAGDGYIVIVYVDHGAAEIDNAADLEYDDPSGRSSSELRAVALSRLNALQYLSVGGGANRATPVQRF